MFFDIDFVEAAGIVVSGTRFDVMTAFRSYRTGIENSLHSNCTLIKCAEYFNYSFNPHDSKEDAKATLYCFDCLISDERFTTYQREEKKKLKEEYPSNKKKIGFSIAFKGGIIWAVIWRLIIIIVGVGVISWSSGIIPRNLESIKMLLLYVKDNIRNNPKVLVASIVVVLAFLTLLIRILQKVFLIPKRILIQIQRLFKND